MDQQSQTLKQTAILGVFFLLLVTTYSSFSHIVTFITQKSTQLYSFQGEVVLIVNFIVYLCGLSRASFLTNYKRQFLIAAICYAINYSFHLLALIVAIIGAIVGGFGASILWVSQGGYMMRLFKFNNINQDRKGYYLGIQNGLVYASSVLGAIIITFGLGLFGNQVYFIILTAIALLGFAICLFFLDPLESNESNQIQVKQENCKSFCDSAKKVGHYFFLMKFLLAAMVLDGLMLGFTASYFNHLIPQPIRNSQNVGIILIINGFGAIIGGYFSGYLSDKMQPSDLGIMGFLFLIINFLLTLLTNFLVIQTLTYPIIISFLWGIGLYFLEGWIFVCCAKVYQGKIETFAVVKQVHTTSFIAFQIYMIISKNKINYVAYLILLIGLSLLAIYSCKKMQKMQPYQKKHEQIVQQISPL